MDMRKNWRSVGLGIALALHLGGLPAGAADKEASKKAESAEADSKAAEKVAMERGSETATPLLKRVETAEQKTKRKSYAQAMKASRAATAKMDAAYMDAAAAQLKARQESERAMKTGQRTPTEPTTSKESK